MKPRVIFWRRIDQPGHDACRIERQGDGWRVAGAAVFMEETLPCQLAYTVECDAGWRTRSAQIRGFAGTEPVALDISVDDHQRWLLNGVEQRELAGALDIDLGFTPATNMLPIRRLEVPVDGAADVRAAWLPFPDLVLTPQYQIYRRTAANKLTFAAPAIDFRAELTVDPDGLVTSYAGLWMAEGWT